MHGGIFHLGILFYNDFHDSGVELILITLGRSAPFEIRDVSAFVAHDKRALKLPCALRIDAEVSGEFHGATHALGDVDERTVGEDGAVEGGEEVVAVRNDRAEVLAHEVGIFPYGFADGAEDDALLLEFFLKGSLHRYGVHHGINGYARQHHALFKRDAQLVESLHEFGVNLLLALALLLLCGVGIIGKVLIIYLREVDMRPIGLLEREPVTVSLEAVFKEPLGFFLLLGNEANNLLVQTLVNNFRLNIGGETVLIFLVRHITDELILFTLVTHSI